VKREAAARLVSLYPAAWRTRYGGEFVHVLRDQPLSLRLALDVIGGAIDARLSPVRSERGMRMTANLIKRCAVGRPTVSTADAWRGAWLMIGAALVLTGGLVGARAVFGPNDYIKAFAAMAFPALMFVMMAAMFLRDASRLAQAVIAGGVVTFFTAIAVLSVWI
jgi:hypothetical protein